MRRLPILALLLAYASPALADDPKYEYKDPTAPPQIDIVKPTIWKANMQLGLVWVAGNAQSIGVSGAALFGVKHYHNELTISGGGTYVSSYSSSSGKGGPLDTQGTSAENWLIRGRYDRYFLKKNTVFAVFQANGDKPAGFVYRLEPQVGYARLFFKSDHQLLKGELGFDYTYEHRVSGSVPRNVDYYSGRLFLFYENKFTPFASFSEGVEMLEAFNHLEGFRLNSVTSLSSTIYKNISLKLNFTVKFNNDAGARPDNLTVLDPATNMMVHFTPPPENSHYDKVDSVLDLVVAVTFL
jgi:hypothetical protein